LINTNCSGSVVLKIPEKQGVINLTSSIIGGDLVIEKAENSSIESEVKVTIIGKGNSSTIKGNVIFSECTGVIDFTSKSKIKIIGKIKTLMTVKTM